MKKSANIKPWGGRFEEKTSPEVEAFTESISFDARLWRYDIAGSIAHASMLARQGIIPKGDAAKIINGLLRIAKDIENGKFVFKPELEDVHMNIETELTKRIGKAGGRLHTARSRNDQIALDLRLYLRAETANIMSLVRRLRSAIVDAARKNLDVIMPGYTHLQKAQPVLLSHHLLAYAEMLTRDETRLSDSLKRINVLPLGACALAGTSLPTDRKYLARQLGFDSVSGNSMDAVSDRDFALEFASVAAILMTHLSRLAEELVLWSSEEFSFVELPDAFTTGSSIMPQKKNPDVCELVRGKSASAIGSLVSLLTLVKGLPLTYNRDLQEDKPPLFTAVDTVKASLSVFASMFPTITFRADRMMEAVSKSYATATDLAEYLVGKGMPFRDAHEVTGRLVLHAIKQHKLLHMLPLAELKRFSRLIERDVYPRLTPKGSIGWRTSEGGTSQREVRRQILRFKALPRK